MAKAAILDFRKPHVLRNEKEYDAAVREINALLDADPKKGSEAYERLEFLSVLVEAYEKEHYPIEDASPQEIVAFMADQHGIGRSELAEMLGGRSRLSEFESGKRELSMGQVRKLRDRLKIPADLLV